MHKGKTTKGLYLLLYQIALENTFAFYHGELKQNRNYHSEYFLF